MRVSSCDRADIDARIASETWERQLRPWIARIVCLELVEKAYEEAEKEAVAEAERNEKAERKAKMKAERQARCSKIRDAVKDQIRHVTEGRLAEACRRPMSSFVKEGFSQISDFIADVV